MWQNLNLISISRDSHDLYISKSSSVKNWKSAKNAIFWLTVLIAHHPIGIEYCCKNIFWQHNAVKFCIWVRSWSCGCLVTWFCYHLIAKPGNKMAAPSWPDPYTITNDPDSKVHEANMGPTWVLVTLGGSHFGPMNLAIRAAVAT